MNIGIDIDNAISNFDEDLLNEYIEHDKQLRNTGVIKKDARYLRKGMFKIKADDAVKENNIEKWLVEYHTFTEGFMEIGRITGFILMLLVGMLNNVIYFKLLLLIVTISIPVYARIMYKLEKDNA